VAQLLLTLAYPMVLIGVDPGGTSGIAVYDVPSADEPARHVGYEQWSDSWTIASQLLALKSKIQKQRPGVQVVFVVEQFDNRPGIVDPDLTPKYIIRDIDRDMANEQVFYQTPSQAKNLVKPAHRGTPDGLKRFGWYKVGMGHANDASRHVIVFLVEKLHHMPTITKGWPKRG
jgi:hypothetical protein